MIEDTITRLARALKAADVDYDTALNISLRLRRPGKAEKLISWLEENKTATPEEISDKSAEIARTQSAEECLIRRSVQIDLREGVPDLCPKENTHCFFYVDRLNDKNFMHAVAQRLLKGKCKDFHFYGKYADEWELAFDETDIALHDNEEEWSLTSWWRSWTDFADALSLRAALEEKIYFLSDADGYLSEQKARQEVACIDLFKG